MYFLTRESVGMLESIYYSSIQMYSGEGYDIWVCSKHKGGLHPKMIQNTLYTLIYIHDVMYIYIYTLYIYNTHKIYIYIIQISLTILVARILGLWVLKLQLLKNYWSCDGRHIHESCLLLRYGYGANNLQGRKQWFLSP